MKGKLLFTTLCLSGLGLLAQVPTNGLIAKYSFNTLPMLTTDNHLNQNTLTATGQVGVAISANNLTGNAAQFTGTENLSVNNANIRPTSVTVSGWFYRTTGQLYNTIAGVRYNTGTAPYNSYHLSCGTQTGSKLNWSFKPANTANDVSLVGVTAVANNTWNHVIATYDAVSGVAKLYLNGVLESTTTVSGVLQYSGTQNPLVIGNVIGVTGHAWVGKLDEILIYNRAVSTTEVALIYNSYKPIAPNTPPSYTLQKYEVAKFNLNGNSNDNGYNSALNNYPALTNNGTVTYGNDRLNNPGGALVTSSTSYLTSSNNAYYKPDTAITLMGWAYRTGTSSFGMIANMRNNTSFSPYNSYALSCGSSFSNKITAILSTSNNSDVTISDANTIVDNQWYFTAMTYSSAQGKVKLFVNGVEVAQANATGVIKYSPNMPLYIGRAIPNGHEWIGKLDDIRIFNKALTTAEMDSIKNLVPNTNGLISQYPMGDNNTDIKSGFDLGTSANSTVDRFGIFSGATAFSGTSIAVDYAQLHKADTALTAEAWIYKTGSQMYSSVLGVRNGQSTAPFNSFLLYSGTVDGDRLVAAISTTTKNDVSIKSPNALPFNQWVHVGFTYSANSGRMKLYINGAKVADTTYSGNIVYSSGITNRLSIGNAAASPIGNHYWIGSLDDIKIFNRSKTEAEFANDFCLNPTASIVTPNSNVCYGNSLNLVGTSTFGVFSGAGVTGSTFNSIGMEFGSIPVYYNASKDGCTARDTLQVNVRGNDNPIVTLSGNDLTAILNGSMQWFDCNANTVIAGETNYIYTPSANGSYAVITNDGGCIDTSACFSYSLLSVTSNANDVKGIDVYPNPTQGKLTVKLNKATVNADNGYKVISLDGKVVLAKTIGQTQVNQKEEIDLSTLEAGIYYIQLNMDDTKTTVKIVKH